MNEITICPYLQFSFQILGKRWNGLILHYLSLCPNGSAHFSELKRDLADITPRALSIKLSELAEYKLVVKNVSAGTPVVIKYELTEQGRALTSSLAPIQQWAKQYKNQNH